MALNIKNPQVEHLLAEVAQITGESKTEAVRAALVERYQRLSVRRVGTGNDVRIHLFLQNEVWPQIPAAQLGVRLSKQDEEAILGYGEEGV